jgi:hypothetical protein
MWNNICCYKSVKKLLLFFLLSYQSALLSQTILNSYPLDFKESNESNEILNVENEQTHEVFVFAADNESISILKYNPSLFLIDQYKAVFKNPDQKSLIGYSFSEDGNPTLYWVSPDYTTILAIKYYFETKTFRILNFRFPASSQYVVAEFQQHNSFNILTKDIKEQSLILYTFKNGAAEERVLDFSSFIFQDKNTKVITFNQLIKGNPIEKMEGDEYNPLYKTTSKSKLYILENRMILTLDHNPKKTQLFDINLESPAIKEKNFTQLVTDKPKRTSNSFFHDDKLYQITASDEELLLDVKDFNSNQSLKKISISKNDTIQFKISPLLVQREGQKASELKTTKKFLRHLSFLDAGLSVFKNKENIYITLGGSPNMAKQNSIFFSAYYPYDDFGFYDNGSSYYPPNYYSGTIHSETVYFESVWSPDYAVVKQEQLEPLAIDNIYYFMSLNKQIALDNILKYKDFYILSYYDTISKQYIMRKFKDGFNTDDPFLDQVNTPSSFKKPFQKRP